MKGVAEHCGTESTWNCGMPSTMGDEILGVADNPKDFGDVDCGNV